MPRIVSTLEFAAKTKDKAWTMMTRIYEQLARVVNGGLSFGIAYDILFNSPGNRKSSDNIDCVWLAWVTPATANTDFIITHNLGRKLNAYLIARKSGAVDIYDSPTNNTIPNPAQPNVTWLDLYGKQQYALRATVANVEMVLLLF